MQQVTSEYQAAEVYDKSVCTPREPQRWQTVNAVIRAQDDAPKPASTAQLREIATMRFAVTTLEQRSRSEFSGFLWRIRLKVARHMSGVLARRAGISDRDAVPELSLAEQDEQLRTHWILQPDVNAPPPVAQDVEWRRELESKVARFTDRLRSRRTDPRSNQGT